MLDHLRRCLKLFVSTESTSCHEFASQFGLYIFFILGVRSLANASRARQFNPLNPPGVGWVPLPQTNMAAVVGRARSCPVVRARSCVVGRAWSVVRGRACVVGSAWSCVVVRGRVRSVMHGRSCVVVHARARSCALVRAWSVIRGRARLVGRGRSCVVVPFCPLRGQHCRAARFAAGQHCRDTNEGRNERTTYNNPLNPPGVGWVKFFYPIR